MSLAPGTRVGAYEIVALLGAGGMGEVYRARDTRLERTVAIKVLPDAFAEDPQLRQRFQREAHAISQLNHPNVCVLYDIGEAGGIRFLVMEHLEGETLEERLGRGPLPVRDAINVAIQIADALHIAHRAGIVHRDLKPGNIYLTKAPGRDGSLHAKLLDFGLAKTAAPIVAVSGSMAPTTPPTVTAQGTILGTFQYMAPEQIEGLEADARTDIFAFGAVLFEMLTAKKAFEGKSRASLLGAILKDEPPPVSQVQPLAPIALDRIVRTCLEKDPGDRWQSARDLLRALEWVSDGEPIAAQKTSGLRDSGTRWQRLVPASLAALAFVGLSAWAVTHWRPAAPESLPMRFAIVPPASEPLTPIVPDRRLAISPDGRHLVYSILGSQLAIRALDRLVAEPIRGLTQTRGPFFSPDGNWIGFFQGTTELKKVAVAGGPSVLISRIPGTGPRGASWSTDGTIVFATSDPNTGLMRVPAGGGEAVVLTKPDAGSGEEDHVWPSVLPSGDAVIFTISAPTPENTQVALLDLATGKWKTLIRGGSGAHYVQSGHLVYGVGRTLYAVNFDPARRELTGYPVPVVDDVATVTTPGSAQAPDFTVSRSGTLVYAPASSSTGGLRTLVWVDREGREEPIGAPARPYSTVRLSPDATRIAADIRDKENDIWIWDLTRRTLGRLTFGPATDTAPLWFPDGRRLLYSSSGNLVSHSADGSGTPQSYSVPLGSSMPMSVSPDGKQLILVQHNDLMALSLEGQAKPITLIREFQGFAEISPDGRWIAYQTNESGQFQVYVRPFPRVDDGKWLISSGGRMPAWSRDGRELFFLENVLFGAQLSLMAVPIETDSGFKVGSPVKLIEGPYFAGPGVRGYDVTADGKRFLMVKEPGLQSAPDATPASLVVVVDWQEELKRRVPAKQ